MRVVQLDFADPEFPASLVELPEPPLPRSDWVRVAVSGGGICGSDLHLFAPTVGPTPTLLSYVGTPMQLGHEVAGTVIETGPDCPVEEGTRVAVDPTLGCAARGIDPWCDHCAAGQTSSCRNLASRETTPGFALGFTIGLGSGWGDQVVAHRSQLHPIPDAVPARGETLHEPLSIPIHGLLRSPPSDGPVLVIGAGIIGLCAVAALRALFPTLGVVALAKHDHQARAAQAVGAHRVVRFVADDSHVEELAEVAQTTVVGGGDLALLTGGFPHVVEAVGSSRSVTDALRFVDSQGTVTLLGAGGISEVDLTPVWFKEVSIVGSINHAHDAPPGPDRSSGRAEHSIDRALELLASGDVPVDTLVTHEFPLERYREAVEAALDRSGSHAIKVVLRP